MEGGDHVGMEEKFFRYDDSKEMGDECEGWIICVHVE